MSPVAEGVDRIAMGMPIPRGTETEVEFWHRMHVERCKKLREAHEEIARQSKRLRAAMSVIAHRRLAAQESPTLAEAIADALEDVEERLEEIEAAEAEDDNADEEAA